jgi:hypothetical protein
VVGAEACFDQILEAIMLSWVMLVLLGFVGWGLGILFVLTLMRMSGDQDVAARREEELRDATSHAKLPQFGA